MTVSKQGDRPLRRRLASKEQSEGLRNLTNRMEEAIGDCTNLHISYPNLVYGFLHIMKAEPHQPRGSVPTTLQ